MEQKADRETRLVSTPGSFLSCVTFLIFIFKTQAEESHLLSSENKDDYDYYGILICSFIMCFPLQ